MNEEQIKQILNKNVGKTLVVDTDDGEQIYLWSTKEKLWKQRYSMLGVLYFDKGELLDILLNDFTEVYRIEVM